MLWRPKRNMVFPYVLLWAFVVLPPASLMQLLTTPPRIRYSVALASEEESNTSSHGRALFPLDVIGSEPTRAGLQILRREQATTGNRYLMNANMEYNRIMEDLKTAGDEEKVALTLMGYKGGAMGDQVNQDSATIVSPFVVGGGGDHEYDPSIQLVGVFDGHGRLGEVTSEHASKAIPKILSEKLRQLVDQEYTGTPISLPEPMVIQAIKEAFIEADQTDPTGGVGGATATMCLQLGHKIYMANAGDSLSFLAMVIDDKVQVVYTTREDKPDLPDERQRINQAGGYVHVPDPYSGDVPRAYHIDEQGRPRFGLAMSRTIGDWKVQGVIAEPIVDVLNIASLVDQAIDQHLEECRENQMTQNMRSYFPYYHRYYDCQPLDQSSIKLVAISTSDGMTDFLKKEYISQEMAESFFRIGGKHPFVAAEHLIIKAAESWDTESYGKYRDDISIAAFKVVIDERILHEGRRDREEASSEL